jgi:cell division protein FtsW (lipid II flippase)
MYLGFVAIVGVSLLPKDLNFFRKYRYTWLIFGLTLLSATLVFGVNPSGDGATLWLKFPFIGRVFFQPSELLKLLLILFLASYFDEKALSVELNHKIGRSPSMGYLAPLLLMWGFCLILLIWQRDLGAATIFFVVFLAMLFLATGDWRYMVLGIGLLLVAGIIGYYAYDVIALRIDTWWNPWPEFNTRGFQIVQSLYSLSAGGVIGQGIAQGYPDFIPVVHSDFVFAAIAEEWGLIGSFVTVVCFSIIVFKAFQIAQRNIRPFHIFLAAGIGVIFSVQALLIMGGITKLLPLTGVTLPFVSYGGSSFFVNSLMIGLLLNLSSQNQREI